MIAIPSIVAVGHIPVHSRTTLVIVASSILSFHFHGSLFTCVVLAMDGWKKVEKERENVECENERYRPFKYSCDVGDMLEVAYAEYCRRVNNKASVD